MSNCAVVYVVFTNHLTDSFLVNNVIIDNGNSLCRVNQLSIAASLPAIAEHISIVA